MRELVIKTKRGAVRGRDEHGIASFVGNSVKQGEVRLMPSE
jgi:hypothetical protein